MLTGEDVRCRGALVDSIESNDEQKTQFFEREASGAEACTLERSTRPGGPCRGVQGREKRVQATRVLGVKAGATAEAGRVAEWQKGPK